MELLKTEMMLSYCEWSPSGGKCNFLPTGSYRLLGVERDASIGEIRKAYLLRARQVSIHFQEFLTCVVSSS